MDFSKTDYSEKSKVLIIDAKDFKMGFLVDEINDILNVSDEQMNKKEINSKNMFVEYEIIEDNDVKFVLNAEKILSNPKMYIEE